MGIPGKLFLMLYFFISVLILQLKWKLEMLPWKLSANNFYNKFFKFKVFHLICIFYLSLFQLTQTISINA